MYNDFRNANRDGWRFTYSSAELQPFAIQRQKQLRKREYDLRTTIAQIMEDRTVAVTSDKVKKLESEIATVATQAEQFDVFVHEFSRKPDREFHLSLADVVFFGIVGEPASE
jgi:hypothetical protein